ncbi:MAG: hypothetical protein HY528_04565 [Chloroflexi bacterium]|nr:hypothetical protein [Chloroflexota bacterium]
MNIRSGLARLSPRPLLVCSFILLVIGLVSAPSCSPGSSSTRTPSTPSNVSATTTSAPYAIAVLQNDKQIASLTISDLSKLTQVKANVAGTDEQGPALLSVLSLAGITDFGEVTVYGFSKGRVTSAELTLKKAEITDNVILALVTRGTAKLTGTDIGAQKMIIDVSKLVVR